jgi:hypothetical protein
MSKFYTDAAADAAELLAELGQSATWTHDNGDSTFNPATGVTSGGTTTAYAAKGALLDFDTNRVDGASIKQTDKRFIMQVGAKPEISDIITIDSVAYQTINILETNPAGTPVIYEVQLRS